MATSILEPKDTLAVEAPKEITSKAQHERYVTKLKELFMKKHLSSTERGIAKLLTLLVADYEANNYQIRAASPVEVLTGLMEDNNLRQKDLAPLLGSEGIVSDVLNGNRKLSKRNIEQLSARFRLSASVFFDK
jgi:HTH-type transcriptional regulator/antitoxin HigA